MLIRVSLMILVVCGLTIGIVPVQSAPAEDGTHPFDMRPQPWQQRQAVLSALTTKQSWCKVVLYSPAVLFKDGKFRIWYIGTSAGSRGPDMAMGYAESDDGIHWIEHPDNPILTDDDIPWGEGWQTPFVLYDQEEKIYKMWFSATSKMVPNPKIPEAWMPTDRVLGYATSVDGIQWTVYPKPIYRDGSRSPFVLKDGPAQYRMWMNVDLGRIFEFTSRDGIEWKRAKEPAVHPSGDSKTCIYPCVLRENGKYYMWYGCHRPGGVFEVFCATSDDGSRWKIDHENAAFPATGDKEDFDGRYTSIPFVLSFADRYMMYYAARSRENSYIDGKGKKRRDGAGVYASIGVAVIPKKAAE